MKISKILPSINGGLNNLLSFFSLFILILFSHFSYAQQKAFPSAYGAGAYASGGRGGNVYHVTSLADDNSVGTFRWALGQPRPATIVFDVSGTIDITTWLTLAGTDVTIAGQTAPVGGITVTSTNSSRFRGQDINNFIVRYLRIRPASESGDDAFEFYGNSNGAYNIIMDHISASYGGDETLSLRGSLTHDITYQRILLAEGKTGSLFGDSANPANSYDNSYLNSLFFNISHRTPNAASNGRVDIINNVVHDWQYRMSLATGDIELNHVNNYYSMGSRTNLGNYQIQLNPLNSSNDNKIYTAGNIIDKGVFEDPNADNRALWVEFQSGQQTTYAPLSEFVDTQYNLIGESFQIKPAAEAYQDVITDVGANASLNADGSVTYHTDTQDSFYLNIMSQGEGANHPYEMYDNVRSWWGEQMYADFQASISATPINTRPENFYVSNPHIPEVWFLANVPEGQDHNDIAPSGYTWLEEYLNQVDGPSLPPVNVTGVAVTPETATINIPETVLLSKTVEPVNATNQTGIWSSSDTTIATVNTNGLVTPLAEGLAVITFTSNDGGFSDSSAITVTAIPIPVESVTVSPQILNAGLFTNPELTATINPDTATDQSGVWSSSDTTIATIDQNGTIFPVAVGTVTMTFTTNDGNFSDSAEVTINDDHFGTYQLYNADTDELIQLVTGGEVFDLNVVGENINFRSIPQGGDNNPDVESVAVQWSGVENGNWTESVPIYAGMTDHTGDDFAPYTVSEGVYTFTINYFSQNSGNGTIVATDVFAITFERGIEVNAGEDQTICEGESVTLTAVGADSYLWNTGETTASITVTPNITTTYTVTGTDTDGISASDDVIVIVNTVPTIDAGTDETICAGESITLTATSSSGLYEWSTGETTQSIIVTPNATSVYTVSTTTNNCSASDTISVTVNATPTAYAGDDVTIVQGDTTTLSASGDGSYLWNTGETSQNITVAPTQTTTYNLVVTTSEGCTDQDSVVVTVQEAVTANAGDDVAICEGESTTLTASGGGSYLWNTGETSDSITVSPLSTTTYTVTVSEGISSDSDTVVVTVNQAPIANAGNDITIIEGDSAELIASGEGNYLWSTGETTQTISVAPVVNTTYSVTVTNASGCFDTDDVNVFIEGQVIAGAGEDVTICEGESTVLTASGDGTYLWNTGETSQSITVNPTSTTIYTVTVSDAVSSDSDDVTVTVNPIPIANAGDDITIIIGNSTELTANGSGNDTYLWSTGETSQTIQVSPNLTTTYTVTITNSYGCSDTDDIIVTVQDAVIADAGDDATICEGDTITLTASGGETYLWSTGETTETITINPLNTTTYTVTVTNGIASDSDTVTVTVNPLPEVNAGEDVTISIGENTTLTASGGNSYVWSTGEEAASISVSPTVTTTYIVTTTINGCSDSDEVTVIVDDAIEAFAGDDQEICIGDDIILTASGGDTYLWNTGETTQSITVSPEETTTYTVTVSNSVMSDSDTVEVTVVDCSTQQEGPADFQFLVYPNPTNGLLYVKISGVEKDAVLSVYSILGHQLLSQDIPSNGGQAQTVEINLTGRAIGFYLVRLNGEDVSLTKKVILK